MPADFELCEVFFIQMFSLFYQKLLNLSIACRSSCVRFPVDTYRRLHAFIDNLTTYDVRVPPLLKSKPGDKAEVKMQIVFEILKIISLRTSTGTLEISGSLTLVSLQTLLRKKSFQARRELEIACYSRTTSRVRPLVFK